MLHQEYPKVHSYSEIRLFADDILLYQPNRTPDDHVHLQEDLNTLTNLGGQTIARENDA